MNCASRRGGSISVGILIVVIIIAVLAVAVVLQPRESSLKLNIRNMRSQIELYKLHHRDDYPTIQDNDLPQLTHATNVNGQIGPPGPDYPYGPYLRNELAPNPYDGSNKVTAVAAPGQKARGVVGHLGGWQYDETTGKIWPKSKRISI